MISRSSKKKSRKYDSIYNLEYLAMSLPALLYFGIFAYLPMSGLILAFKTYRYDLGILGSKWVGFNNFKFFFTSGDALEITRNTVGYGISFLVIGTVAAIVVALMLFEISKGLFIKIYQTIMITPSFMSWVVVSFITYIFLNPVTGVMNAMLGVFSIEPVNWYMEGAYWPTILNVVNLWKGIGISVVLYYSRLMAIDKELFEAASIDGAKRLQQIVYISLPALVPLVSILALMAIGNIFRGDFGLFYQIPRNSGILYDSTDIIDTYLFRALSKSADIGRSTAIGFFQSFVGLILVLATNKIIKKINPENAIF